MHIKLKRLVDSGCRSRSELEQRLEFWAERYRFQKVAENDGGFEYTRGSQWHAFYTFDIRKVPTTVRIKLIDEKIGDCVCTMECGSWLQLASSGDRERLSEQMDLLEACVKGALTEFPTRDMLPSYRSDDRDTGSEHIQETG